MSPRKKRATRKEREDAIRREAFVRGFLLGLVEVRDRIHARDFARAARAVGIRSYADALALGGWGESDLSVLAAFLPPAPPDPGGPHVEGARVR